MPKIPKPSVAVSRALLLKATEEAVRDTLEQAASQQTGTLADSGHSATHLLEAIDVGLALLQLTEDYLNEEKDEVSMYLILMAFHLGRSMPSKQS